MTKDELERLASTLGGLSILGCLPGSPGEKAGLKYGDVLLEVNGTRTPDLDAYLRAIADRDSTMHLRVFRNGREETLTLWMEPQPAPMSPLNLLQRVLASGALPARFGPVDPPDDPRN